jgi:hypothetical protein
MGYMLRNGLSFCETGGRILFLDIDRDRYFCLTQQSEAGFRRMVADEATAGADALMIKRLVSDGLLVAAPAGARPTACPPARRPARSLLDVPGQAGTGAVASALARLGTANLALRMLPLHRVLARLRHRKRKQDQPSLAAPDATLEIAAAFRRSSRIVSPLNRCLPRSIAAAHALLASGARPDLVIGVRLNPFNAHCWVQCGDTLVNESLDEVRNFTPILVI